MKRIISGRSYNTATATEIGSYSNNLGVRNFRDLAEGLYRSGKGQHFLAGRGGAMTAYANSEGTTRWAGSGIILLDDIEAMGWAERHCSTAVIEQHFAPEEG